MTGQKERSIDERLRALEKRIEDIEASSAYQDKMQAELSAVLAEQQKMIDSIVPHLRSLSARVEQMQDADAKPPQEKPPHY